MNYPELPECLRPSSMEMTLKSNVKAHVSPFTGTTQTVGWRGSRWALSMNFDNLSEWESRQLEAFMFGLDGMAGRAKLRDAGRNGVVPRGNPVVFGAAQLGTILATSGWQPEAKVLEVGDYLTVQDELKQVTKDAWSDINGRATIEFTPQLRNPTNNGAPVEVREPYGIFMLDANDNGVSRKPAFMSSINLKWVEAIV